MHKNEQLILTLLKTCKITNHIKQLHAHATKTGLVADQFLSGKFIFQCAVTISDALYYARHFLFHLPNPDVFMYNTLIRGFSESNEPQNAILTYIEMRRKMWSLPPDSFSFAFVLKAAANFGCLKSGSQLHCQAICCNFDTHLFVGTTLVSMYAECGVFVFAKKVFDEMFEPNLVVWNAIVTACFRCSEVQYAEEFFKRMPYWNLTTWNVMLAGYMKDGQVDLAKRLFFEMGIKDDVSWSTMIVGFSQNGSFDGAFELFRELHRIGIRPNEACLTGVLSACAQAGAFRFGKIIHGSIEKYGFLRIVSVNNALLDTYSRCGNVGMARMVFERMPGRRSIVSWTSMIAGLAMHGYGEEAIQVFNKMEESGIIPDGIAFISILYACSHAGLMEQGLLYFSKMTDLYEIEPSIEHYGCMVDLYGRSGQLQKAYDFINKMPIPITDVIWRILLGACSIHGDVKLAERVKEHLSELDLVSSSDHVLLSNIYANVGKWNDVAFVRRSMVGQKIKKNPGWSMIEVDRVMYRFMIGQKQSEIIEEAYEKLKEIMLKIRVEGGYVAEVKNVFHDIEDEEKEDAVSKHSEKLAVAFGISRICDGIGMIRIVKNLRVCGDCHTVMKLISMVYRLEIVVRDRSRFHSFKDGVCSCGDYW